MNRILFLFFTLLIYGCATKPITNVNDYSANYYRDIVSKSKNYQDFKDYFLKNNMKLGTLVSMSYSQFGGLANYGLDGERKSFFYEENNKWLKRTMSNFVVSELSGLIVDVEGYTLTFCGDFGHASMGDNGAFGTAEYTYFLSNITEAQRQLFFQQPVLSDCEYDALLGDVFYKKKVKVSSNISTAKVTTIKKDESLPITSLDSVSLILYDLSEQAMTAMLTDADLFQALKDYKLTGGKKLIEPVVNKAPVSESSSTTTNIQAPAVNMEKYKTQCKELGFKLGTADYGNCVLQLMK
ncbi:MAG: hypothetical protein RLZZ66_1703 [Pseudomonadota bacterium]|jgi:hypothetical protein